MQNVSMSAKGQLVIPKELRARVGLVAGGRVSVRVDGRTLVLEPVGAEDGGWRNWRGTLKGTQAMADLKAEHRAEVEADS